MADRFFPFARDDVLPSFFANALQDFAGSQAANVKLRASTSNVKLPAGTGGDLVAIAIQGRWRFVTADITRAHPGGAAGIYDIFAVAKDNNISNTPVVFTDSTDYSFDLRIVASGGTPTIVAGTLDIYRKIGSCVWDGSNVSNTWLTIGTDVDVLAGRWETIVERKAVISSTQGGTAIVAGAQTGSINEAGTTAGEGGFGAGDVLRGFSYNADDNPALPNGRVEVFRLKLMVMTNNTAPGLTTLHGLLTRVDGLATTGDASSLTDLLTAQLIIPAATTYRNAPFPSVIHTGAPITLTGDKVYLLRVQPAAAPAASSRIFVFLMLQRAIL